MNIYVNCYTITMYYIHYMVMMVIHDRLSGSHLGNFIKQIKPKYPSKRDDSHFHINEANHYTIVIH